MTEQKRKTEQKKLADLAQKIEQLQARKTALEKKVKADERKRRTKRLIEIGAIVEAYAGEITDLNELKTYLEKYGANIAKTQQQKKINNNKSTPQYNGRAFIVICQIAYPAMFFFVLQQVVPVAADLFQLLFHIVLQLLRVCEQLRLFPYHIAGVHDVQ